MYSFRMLSLIIKKQFLFSIFVLISMQLFAQDTLVFNQVESEYKKETGKYFVHKDCKDLSNSWDNNSCSKKKITDHIFKYFDWEKIESKEIEYKIWFKFYFNEEGLISKYEIQTDELKVKSQIVKLLNPILSDFSLVDNNNQPIAGQYGFPCRISLVK
ncbi:hypothetical protein CLV90_3349 [Maribacter spongiicola]|uniref:TonB-like protein n=2 Tax=Maribacter spongiicola TaxID=1206753 RepID=A0A4R7JQR7_9FLAO|nr:hypothetical protein CLV90_3349 [Maribacter spongiicola]